VIVDTSALVAIIRQEPDARYFEFALDSSPSNRISAGTWLETTIVIDRLGDPLLSRRLDELLAAARLVIELVTAPQARIAREAYRDFGRGTLHAAGLNFEDCFAYALARETGEPLLFKGDDFVHTDIPYLGPPAERGRLGELRATYRTGSCSPAAV
jgi:ribonuclease VapC